MFLKKNSGGRHRIYRFYGRHRAHQNLITPKRSVLIGSGIIATALTGFLLAPTAALAEQHSPGEWVTSSKDKNVAKNLLNKPSPTPEPTTAPKSDAQVALEQPNEITVGDSVILKGNANQEEQPAKNATIYIDQKNVDNWQYLATINTDEQGSFSFELKPDDTTTLRAVVGETDKYHQGVSGEITLTVKPAPEPEPEPTPTPEPQPEPTPEPTTQQEQTPEPQTPPSQIADRGQIAVDAAAAHAGKPYVFGAAGPDAFDCSGLVIAVYSQFGIAFPHDANAQGQMGTSISEAEARPGDLVFFGSGYYHHVGIYAGNGEIWHAPTPGQVVKKEAIWAEEHVFRRVL